MVFQTSPEIHVKVVLQPLLVVENGITDQFTRPWLVTSLRCIISILISRGQACIEYGLKGPFGLGADLVVSITWFEDAFNGGDQNTEMLDNL